MTTLELARYVAYDVIRAHLGFIEDPKEETVLAVLKCLHEHDSWFCRLKFAEDEHGRFEIGSTPYEVVQLDLFQP
jgi:predicted nucleotidyltransferase